jgi:hypothetical protein
MSGFGGTSVARFVAFAALPVWKRWTRRYGMGNRLRMRSWTTVSVIRISIVPRVGLVERQRNPSKGHEGDGFRKKLNPSHASDWFHGIALLAQLSQLREKVQ